MVYYQTEPPDETVQLTWDCNFMSPQVMDPSKSCLDLYPQNMIFKKINVLNHQIYANVLCGSRKQFNQPLKYPSLQILSQAIKIPTYQIRILEFDACLWS